jgi:hypothetical protein
MSIGKPHSDLFHLCCNQSQHLYSLQIPTELPSTAIYFISAATGANIFIHSKFQLNCHQQLFISSLLQPEPTSLFIANSN